MIALSNGRESYINNYQNTDPLILREIIDNIKKELDNKFSAFLEKDNLGFIPSCYFPLFFWHRYFKKMTIDKQDLKDIGFDVIIGNPPYGRAQLNRTQVIMKDSYSSYIDIYTNFIERSIEHLKEGGKLGYIVPVTWETGTMYDTLWKRILLKCKMDFIVNLPFDVFKDAYVDTCIIVLSKQTTFDPILSPASFNPFKSRPDEAAIIKGDKKGTAYPRPAWTNIGTACLTALDA